MPDRIPDRRHDLIRWATTNDAFAIEDDYDAEFRYDRRRACSLAAVRRHGVRVSGMDLYRMRPRDDAPRLVVGYGNVVPPAIRRGLDIIVEVVRDLDRG